VLILLVNLLIINKLMQAQTANLKIEITGIKNQKGNLMIGLYDNGSLFPQKNSATAGHHLKINSLTETYSFKNLKHGNYAVAIIHDEDMDGELSTNFLGIPIEGFGFSNNAMGTFGPPKFEKAQINLDRDKTISIKLRY